MVIEDDEFVARKRRMPLSVAFDRWIDFCVWVLEVDGLQVPPFDRHGPGDGSLRARGLDAAGWIAWLRIVVAQQARRQNLENAPMDRWMDEFEAGKRPGPATFAESERREVHELGQQTPALMWVGDRAMVEALSELWWRYGRLGTRGGMDLQRPVGGPELRDRMAPFAAHLSRLQILLVDYPGVVAFPIPPDTVLLAVRGPRLSAETYDDAVLSAVPRLMERHEDGGLPTQPPGPTMPGVTSTSPSPARGASETGPSAGMETQLPTGERGEPKGDAFERLALRLLALSYESSMRGIGKDADELTPPRLFPAQLPDDLPIDLPLPDEHDLLGSFTMGMHAIVLLETTLTPFQVRDFYRAQLMDAGWTEAPTFGARRTGFEARDGFSIPDVYCRSEHGPSLHLMVQPGRQLRTEVHLLVDTEVDAPQSPCSSRRRQRSELASAQMRTPIPELPPPDNAVHVHEGTGSRGDRHTSQGRLQTDLDLSELVRYYDEQLQIGGWSRQGGGQVGGLAWSLWSFQSDDGAEGYGLFWVVHDSARPGHYAMTDDAIGHPPR